jgi:hypothetical protein
MILRFSLLGLLLCLPARAADPLTTGAFHWVSSPPLVGPVTRPEDPCVSIKDPTVIFHDGRWHLFCTIRSEKRTHQIEYLNFTDWRKADAAPRHVLKLPDEYGCAPHVFWFTALKKWCLLYQARDNQRVPALRPVILMSDRIDDPTSWSQRVELWDRSWTNCPRAIDFWLICDAAQARLFFTSNDGKLWRSDAPLAGFPRGFGEPKLVLKADLFEASCTYKIKGREEYLTLVEAEGGGGRYYKAWVAPRLDAEWKPLAATWEKPFASRRNVAFPVGAWTDSISHGELVRTGTDETMEIDSAELRFLYQGVAERDYRGQAYGKIPWRLGMLELKPGN